MKKNKSVHKIDRSTTREDLKTEIIKAAIRLLSDGGREALTTRSLSEAAEVQAPTLYRLFGDMRGLVDAVAEYGLVMAFKKKKEYKPSADPVADLRKIWEQHTVFGIENPVIYILIFGNPRPDFVSPAAQESKRLLTDLIHRIAISGRLRVTERRAAELIFAASSGAVLSLLAMPEGQRDLSLASDTCEAVIAAITNDSAIQEKAGAAAMAIALKASLPKVKSLTAGEAHLLTELLERISTHG